MASNKRSYGDIQQQIQQLQQEAEQLRAEEAAGVLEDIRAKVATYGFTERDIFGRKRAAQNGKKPQARAAGEAKYLNPKTGQTWSGRGRAPAWIASAKNRDRFLIAK
jgi:DNA-binding protein H-NS